MNFTIGYGRGRGSYFIKCGAADPQGFAPAREALAAFFGYYDESWSDIELDGSLDGDALTVERAFVLNRYGSRIPLTYAECGELAGRLRESGAFGSVARTAEEGEPAMEAIRAGMPYSIEVAPGEGDGELVVDIRAWQCANGGAAPDGPR